MGMDSEVRAIKSIGKLHWRPWQHTPTKNSEEYPSFWDLNSELRITALSLMLIGVNYTILHLYSLHCMKNGKLILNRQRLNEETVKYRQMRCDDYAELGTTCNLFFPESGKNLYHRTAVDCQ